ncbi:uncharacterized protein DNG_02607 [Cephalotrichum gorgonifer]|uniref:DUF7728 domain-containing protein n=1 Tax=Cephalotrichum gorgonifer TaxID=2041049 RepID=A0AAE8ST83_9PEZI|nr:uncharacterized protein DNG_02607 [Cephalotrichum gorgonifer]
MLVKSALTAALAATAHSFLVPPDFSADDIAFAQVAPLDLSENDRAISVECAGCPVSVPEGSGPAVVSADVPNRLDMVFSIEASPAGDRFLANGFELFPNPETFPAPLVAEHVSGAIVNAHLRVVSETKALGYQVHIYPLAKDDGQQFIEVIAVDLQIVEVGGVFVDDIPLVKVLLGKKGDDLAIMDVETVQPTGPSAPEAECTTFICSLKTFFAGMKSSFKRPCPGRLAGGFHDPPHHGPPHHGLPPPPPPPPPPHHGLPPPPPPPPPPPHDAPPHHGPPHHGPPHHGPPHDMHHHPHFSHHGHVGSVLSVVAMVVMRLVLPIVFGIFVGVLVGLIAMAFLSFVQVLSAAVRRRKSQPKSHKAESTEAVIVDEEKAGLLEGQEDIEPPPSAPKTTSGTPPSSSPAAAAAAVRTSSPPPPPTRPTLITRSSSTSPDPARPRTQSYLPSSILAPRVAVALNVPKPWHLLLFASRLLSIAPAASWGWPSALLLLDGVITSFVEGGGWEFAETASALACIWCFAAGYLSFFFTDCLMSRWLINYTPQATVVRLLAINAVNAYVTSTVLSLLGGFHDARLLLPGWIGIATTLTICYHITHQQITIRKETSTSINVFSIASFISMLALLALLYSRHKDHPDFPDIPLVAAVRRLVAEARRAARSRSGAEEL